jgi:hypothetical protein
MASFTSRLAGWAAGRLGGQKAKEKTMDWMGKTGVGKALSFAGDTALMGGAGKLAGMAGRAAGFGKAATTAGRLPAGVTEVGRLASANPAEAGSMVSRMVQPITSVPATAFKALPESTYTPSMVDRLQGLGRTIGRGVSDVAGRAVDFAKANPVPVGRGLEAFAALQQNQAAQNIARERLGLERQQMEQSMEQRRRMAEALQPLLAQLRSRMGGMG